MQMGKKLRFFADFCRCGNTPRWYMIDSFSWLWILLHVHVRFTNVIQSKLSSCSFSSWRDYSDSKEVVAFGHNAVFPFFSNMLNSLPLLVAAITDVFVDHESQEFVFNVGAYCIWYVHLSSKIFFITFFHLPALSWGYQAFFLPAFFHSPKVPLTNYTPDNKIQIRCFNLAFKT